MIAKACASQYVKVRLIILRANPIDQSNQRNILSAETSTHMEISQHGERRVSEYLKIDFTFYYAKE